jgi:hypothetical protein
MPWYGWDSEGVSSSTVASIIRWTTTCGFMVLVFASSRGRRLSDSVVNSHEVGIFRELGDDFTHMYPLSLTCYRRDRYEALFGGGVHPVGELIECRCGM